MTRATFGTSLNRDYIQPILDIALRYNALDHPVVALVAALQRSWEQLNRLKTVL
jgi:hypothetical protein